MTGKALGLLDKYAKSGFFLMVEGNLSTCHVVNVLGSLIDVCGHRNDAPCNVREALVLLSLFVTLCVEYCIFNVFQQYDATVGTILDFTKDKPNTLVVSVSDHETGGTESSL